MTYIGQPVILAAGGRGAKLPISMAMISSRES